MNHNIWRYIALLLLSFQAKTIQAEVVLQVNKSHSFQIYQNNKPTKAIQPNIQAKAGNSQFASFSRLLSLHLAVERGCYKAGTKNIKYTGRRARTTAFYQHLTLASEKQNIISYDRMLQQHSSLECHINWVTYVYDQHSKEYLFYIGQTNTRQIEPDKPKPETQIKQTPAQKSKVTIIKGNKPNSVL